MATLQFLDAKENVLLLGPPGTGKSHVAKALALLAVGRGYTVLYREAHHLIEDLHEARELGELRKYRAQLKAADLLLIDDLFLRTVQESQERPGRRYVPGESPADTPDNSDGRGGTPAGTKSGTKSGTSG